MSQQIQILSEGSDLVLIDDSGTPIIPPPPPVFMPGSQPPEDLLLNFARVVGFVVETNRYTL